jgi:DNA repair exonuclease SbcCD ATPase subunit
MQNGHSLLDRAMIGDVVVPLSARAETPRTARPDLAAALETVDKAARLMASIRADADVAVREAHAALAGIAEQLSLREAELAEQAARGVQLEQQLNAANREAIQASEAAERKARLLEERIEELVSRAQRAEDQLEKALLLHGDATTELQAQLAAAERRSHETEHDLKRLATYLSQKLGPPIRQAAAA